MGIFRGQGGELEILDMRSHGRDLVGRSCAHRFFRPVNIKIKYFKLLLNCGENRGLLVGGGPRPMAGDVRSPPPRRPGGYPRFFLHGPDKNLYCGLKSVYSDLLCRIN